MKSSSSWLTRLPAAGMLLVVLPAGGCLPAGDVASEDTGGCAWEGWEPVSRDSGPVTESHVYLDLSRTMSGFISEGRGDMPVTLQQDLLRTILLEALGDIGLTPPNLWGFGREVFPLPRSLASYAARMDTSAAPPRALYDQAESDVVGALLAASKQPAALSIVLTDNAQDLRQPKDRRAPGFDRSAMSRVLAEDLAGSGFGVWLVGFRTEFRGAYFSVLLAADGRGVEINRPVLLRSAQPLYAWVVGKDLEKGRRVVDHLVERLRRRWRVRHGDGEAPTYAVELAPGVAPRVVPVLPSAEDLAVAGADATTPAVDEIDLFRVWDWQSVPEDPPTVEATLAYRRPRSAELSFLLKAELADNLPGDEQASRRWGDWPLAAWRLDWERSPTLQGPLYRLAGDLAPFAPAPDGSTRFRRLTVAHDQITGYAPADRRLTLPLWVSFQPDAIPDDHWLRAWSTDDDTTLTGVEGRTLYLFDVVRTVLAQTTAHRRPAACFQLTLVEE